MEELLIQRQKRIAERSASSGNSSTLRKTVSDSKSSMTSNAKTGIQSPAKESAKVQKPVFRSSTIDRLAATRGAKQPESTQAKSEQTKKTVSKANGAAAANKLKKAAGAEVRKSSANKAKQKEKQHVQNAVNEIHPTESDVQDKKDRVEVTAASPDVSAAHAQATQLTDATDDYKDIKELHSIPSTEKPEEVKVFQTSTMNGTNQNQNTNNSEIPEPAVEESSKGHPDVYEDKRASEYQGSYNPERTLSPTPALPNKDLSAPSNGESKATNHNVSFRSPEISEIKVSTPPPSSEMNVEPFHSRRKWNEEGNSPKAVKGFRKLLMFGRRKTIYMA